MESIKVESGKLKVKRREAQVTQQIRTEAVTPVMCKRPREKTQGQHAKEVGVGNPSEEREALNPLSENDDLSP